MTPSMAIFRALLIYGVSFVYILKSANLLKKRRLKANATNLEVKNCLSMEADLKTVGNIDVRM